MYTIKYVTRIKDKNYMIISIDEIKALDKNSTSLHDKRKKLGIEGSCLTTIKTIYDKLIANIACILVVKLTFPIPTLNIQILEYLCQEGPTGIKS
jgi:hypothetical protein